MEKITLSGFTRVAIAGLLIVQLATAQAGSGVRESIAAIAPRALVDVQLADGSGLRGRVISHSDADFVLKQSGVAGTKTIAYDQVRSVSQVKASHSRVKWAIIGSLAGAAVVVAIVGILIARSGY